MVCACFRSSDVLGAVVVMQTSCVCPGCKADNYGIGKQKTKQVFPFVVLKPTQALASLVLFHSLPGQQKKKAFRTQHLTAATSHHLTGHGS